MSYVGLKRGGRETSRYFLLPESMEDLARTGSFVYDVVEASGRRPLVDATEIFSRDWAARLGLGHLRVEGIPLPSLVDLQFKFRLNFLLMLFEFARLAVSRERPDTAVLSGVYPEERRILRHAFESMGVKVEDAPGRRSIGMDGLAFRLGTRLRRIAQVSLPRYSRYLQRMVSLDRTPTVREDPRILVVDSYALSPEACRYLKDRGTLLHVLDKDRGIKKILLQSGVPFRSVRLKGTSPADWPAPDSIRFPEEGVSWFTYEGIPFFRFMEGSIRWAVWDVAPRLFAYRSLPGEGFRKIILREQNFPEGKMLVWFGRQSGIKTIMMQHGLIVADHGYLPMDADVFVAWGEEGRRWMEARGVSPHRVEVIGFPRFDSYANKGGGCDGKGFGREMLVVFENTDFGGEDTPADNYRLLHLVLEAISPLDGWKVVVRFHPGQPTEEREACRRVVRPLYPHVRIDREMSLGKSLAKVDVVLTECSTVGMEALLQGKLLLVVRAKGLSGNPYLETDALPRAGSVEEIREYLRKWEQSDAARREAREQGKAFLDGYLRCEREPASVRFWKYCLS